MTHAEVELAKPYDSITVLTPQAQQALPLVTAMLQPGHRHAQKNLGYLYAIALGADVVYDAEDGLPLHIGESAAAPSLESLINGRCGRLHMFFRMLQRRRPQR